MACENQDKSAARYKKNFDRKARSRTFKVGDKVLILLPTESNKLTMQWKGPYTVSQTKGLNDYAIKIGEKEKVYHVNMLKAYIERPAPQVQDQVGNSKERDVPG